VDAVTLEQAVAWAEGRIAARAVSRIGAVNAAKLVKLERDPALARAVAGCDLVVADGMSVVWAARLLTGVRLARVAGIDLMEALLERASRRGYRVYFLGARAEVLERMLAVLRETHPGLVVAGSHHGYFTPADEPRLVQEIRESGADLLFVAMGTPAKELWVDRNAARAAVPLCMGVGGSFDVLAGVVKRAPRRMQDAGLEWLYRLAQEPRRLWRRYLTTGVVFVGEVLARAARRPFRRG
jgi:N-acetylglucosaminyldiphosphoundecaprenol N-acetyl-beta-D-mannosaminyltransferase